MFSVRLVRHQVKVRCVCAAAHFSFLLNKKIPLTSFDDIAEKKMKVTQVALTYQLVIRQQQVVLLVW